MSEEFEEKHKEAFLDFLENANIDDDLEFDMYARDIEDFKWLKEFIPEIIVYSAGGIIPFQAEGYIGAFNFYYRERGGVASLSVANSKEECYGLVDSLYNASAEVEEFREGLGWFSTLMNLLEKLEKTPYRYQFQTDNLKFPKDNDPSKIRKAVDESGKVVHDSLSGWGFTVEEAFEDASQRLEWMRELFCHRTTYDRETGVLVPDLERSWSNEAFENFVELTNLQPIVVRTDGGARDYTENNPVFEVRVPEVWRDDERIIHIPDDFWDKGFSD